MLDNTGTVSFILYGIFIAITIIATVIAFFVIYRGKLETAKLDKMIELFKYAIITVAIATVTLIVSDLFKEREQDVKELEYFDKYTEDVKKADNIQARFQLAKYLSIVAPSGELKKSWTQYYDSTNIEYQDYLKAKQQKQILDTVQRPTPQQINKKEQLNEIINLKEAPLVSYKDAPSVSYKKSTLSDFTTAKIWEQKGFDFLLNHNLLDAVNAFVASENAANGYHQVYEIAQYLRNQESNILNSEGWKEIYSDMATRFSLGMPQATKDRFLALSK